MKFYRKAFVSLDEFLAFNRFENVIPRTGEFLDFVLRRVRSEGLYCDFHQATARPDEVAITSENYRETLEYRTFNARQRAVNYEVLRVAAPIGDNDVRIYAPEAVTAFALAYRGRFPKFLGSEYAAEPATARALFPILAEDLQSLSFPDEVFDIVVANEVFEHVPVLDRALAELSRVLKPGGHMIATFPFNSGSDDDVVRARLEHGAVVHVMEPEYHGNPIDPAGSLVFEIPGWSILGRTERAGFSWVRMVWIYAPERAIMAFDTVGIFVLVARK